MLALYRKLQRYLHNSLWIIGERICSMAFALIATIFVARYLGPDRFGSLAYALSLASLFGVAGHLGLHGLVVREIVKEPSLRGQTLGTTAALKFLALAGGYLLLVVYGAFYEGVNSIEFGLILIAGAALLFRPFEVVDLWFQAFVQARYAAIARLLSSILATAFKLSLVIGGASLLYFAAAPLIQAAAAAIIFLILFRMHASIALSDWRFDCQRAKSLLSQGWLVYVGSIFAVIYLKVDQIMLRWLANTVEVGQYAIAAQLSEVWYFVPAAVVASFFPRLIELHEKDANIFKNRFQQLFDALFLLGLCVALVMTLVAPWLIPLLFGTDYLPSVEILIIHIWAAIFIFMRAAFSKWILIENALIFSLITHALGAIINVALNYHLIPKYGGVGAAYATLMSYATASFFALFFYRKTRTIFWQMAWALLSPIRYPIRYLGLY